MYDGTQAGHEAPELMLITFADVDAGRVTQQKKKLALTSVFVCSHVDTAALGLQEVTNYVPQLRLAAPLRARHAEGCLARCVWVLHRVRQPVEEAGVLRRVAAAQYA